MDSTSGSGVKHSEKCLHHKIALFVLSYEPFHNQMKYVDIK